MATPAFDVQGARAAGYSDDEILAHLMQSRTTFDLNGARKEGYSTREIVDYLASQQPQQAQPQQPGFFERAWEQLNPAPLIEHPIDSVKAIFAQPGIRANQAIEAAKQGNYRLAAGRALEAIPILGMAAEGGEKMADDLRQGNYGGAAGDFVGTAAGPVVYGGAGKLAGKAASAAGTLVEKAAPVVQKAVPRVARSIGTGVGAQLGGSPGAILGGEVGDAIGQGVISLFKRGAPEADILDGIAQSLSGKKFANLSDSEQTAVRTMYGRMQAYDEAQAAKRSQPQPIIGPVNEQPGPTPPGKTLVQMLDEELAARRAAKTAALTNPVTNRTPVWQNVPEAQPTAPARVQPIVPEMLPSGRVPFMGADAPPVTPQAPRQPVWANLPEATPAAPSQLSDLARPQLPSGRTPGKFQPNASEISNDLNASLAAEKSAGAQPAENPPAQIDFEGLARAAKVAAIGDLLLESGASPDDVAQLVGSSKGPFWEQAALQASQKAGKNFESPSIVSQRQIVEYMRSKAPAAAAEPAAPAAPAEPVPTVPGANFEDAHALARTLQSGGIQPEAAARMSPRDWNNLARGLGQGEPSPATAKQARAMLDRFAQSAGYEQGLADAMNGDGAPPRTSAAVRGPSDAQRMTRPGGSQTPPTGPHGPIFSEFRGDAAGAVAKLKQAQTGEAPGALHHPDVGDIDLIWGQAPAKGVEGYGLAKIVAKHPDVAENLQQILDNSQVVSKSPNRVVLSDPTHNAVVRLEFNGVAKKWLLTAYEKAGPKP